MHVLSSFIVFLLLFLVCFWWGILRRCADGGPSNYMEQAIGVLIYFGACLAAIGEATTKVWSRLNTGVRLDRS